MVVSQIHPDEPVRYAQESRRFWNNGFRRRWLASGTRHRIPGRPVYEIRRLWNFNGEASLSVCVASFDGRYMPMWQVRDRAHDKSVGEPWCGTGHFEIVSRHF
jgi:hypothetical protein